MSTIFYFFFIRCVFVGNDLFSFFICGRREGAIMSILPSPTPTPHQRCLGGPTAQVSYNSYYVNYTHIDIVTLSY